MKKRLLLAALILFMGVALCGCSVWEDTCAECIPLPEVETPVDPGPWDPDGSQAEPVGK